MFNSQPEQDYNVGKNVLSVGESGHGSTTPTRIQDPSVEQEFLTSPLGQELNRTVEEVDNLHRNITMLENRLGVIMVEPTPSEGGNKSEEVPAQRISARRITALSVDRIKRANERLQQILERLEI